MSANPDRTLYRFDPHDDGIWLGLGLVRLSLLCGSLFLAAVALYAGRIAAALVLLVLVPPILLARREGLPLLAWIALRLAHEMTGARIWAVDPERVGFATSVPEDHPTDHPRPREETEAR